MNNSVFVLEASEYYEAGLTMGVFSTFEKCIEYAKTIKEWHSFGAAIHEFVVDAQSPDEGFVNTSIINEWCAGTKCNFLTGAEIAERLINGKMEAK